MVTGLGVISPLGNDTDTLFSRLMAAESGIRLTNADGPRGQYSVLAAPVEFDPARYFSAQQKIDILDRVSRFTLAAAAEALRDSGITLADESRRRTGVSLGTGMGAAGALEETYVQLLLREPDRLRPMTVLTAMQNAAAAHVAIQHGLGGPNHTYSCACASSAVSIGEAWRQIRHGYADVMVAGGAEAPLTFGFIKAWEALRVLAPADQADPSASCKPFSKNRSGLVLGEGAAMVVLEEREVAVRRGARIYGELAGYATANDPGHITKPSVAGQAHAMTLALEDAGLQPGDVDYVNAHGTGTALNDVTELHTAGCCCHLYRPEHLFLYPGGSFPEKYGCRRGSHLHGSPAIWFTTDLAVYPDHQLLLLFTFTLRIDGTC